VATLNVEQRAEASTPFAPSTNLSSQPVSDGFTLLEVIVAMTILALGFSALFAGMSQSARNVTKLENVQRREMFTRNLLSELDLIQQLRPGDASSGVFDDGTRWRFEIQPFVESIAQNPATLVRVELRLEWDTGSGIQRKTIETYRLVKTLTTSAPSLDEQLRVLQ
jgi:prepilin-type N-terminal cleavage/methylation domain-containing protein